MKPVLRMVKMSNKAPCQINHPHMGRTEYLILRSENQLAAATPVCLQCAKEIGDSFPSELLIDNPYVKELCDTITKLTEINAQDNDNQTEFEKLQDDIITLTQEVNQLKADNAILENKLKEKPAAAPIKQPEAAPKSVDKKPSANGGNKNGKSK